MSTSRRPLRVDFHTIGAILSETGRPPICTLGFKTYSCSKIWCIHLLRKTLFYLFLENKLILYAAAWITFCVGVSGIITNVININIIAILSFISNYYYFIYFFVFSHYYY